MTPDVEISFDCLPLRSIQRFDLPIDASDELIEEHAKLKRAIEHHGLHNSYYLHAAQCVFHLTNDPEIGMLAFVFEGVVLTDPADRHAISVDLEVGLHSETCDWLTEPTVEWFHETVRRAVQVEFDRYITAGDLGKTLERLERIEAESDAHGGFLGLGL